MDKEIQKELITVEETNTCDENIIDEQLENNNIGSVDMLDRSRSSIEKNFEKKDIYISDKTISLLGSGAIRHLLDSAA